MLKLPTGELKSIDTYNQKIDKMIDSACYASLAGMVQNDILSCVRFLIPWKCFQAQIAFSYLRDVRWYGSFDKLIYAHVYVIKCGLIKPNDEALILNDEFQVDVQLLESDTSFFLNDHHLIKCGGVWQKFKLDTQLVCER